MTWTFRQDDFGGTALSSRTHVDFIVGMLCKEIEMQPWLIVFALAAVLAQSPRTVTGVYRNPGRGFAIEVPKNATGILEGDPVIEHGITIALPSGGSIDAYGEPNSFEWPTPADGLRWSIETERQCSSGGVHESKVGRLGGAAVRLSCGERSIRLMLAFRPGGGPIYWLRLETRTVDEDADAIFLERVASSFQIIRWR